MHPKARIDELLIEEVFNELVVYDCRTQQAHRLNPTAAFVWRNCDGNSSVANLVAMFSEEFGVAVSEPMVLWAIESLTQAGLLENGSSEGGPVRDTSRRAALRKLSMTGALTVIAPIVATLAAPTPAQAGSGTGARRWGGSDHENVRKHWVSRRNRGNKQASDPDHTHGDDESKGKKKDDVDAGKDGHGNRGRNRRNHGRRPDR